MQTRRTQAGVGEPGRVGVEVHVFHIDWQVGTGAPRHTDTHQRVLLLGRHNHLKHPQGVGKREVEMLQGMEVQRWKSRREFNRRLNWLLVFSCVLQP